MTGLQKKWQDMLLVLAEVQQQSVENIVAALVSAEYNRMQGFFMGSDIHERFDDFPSLKPMVSHHEKSNDFSSEKPKVSHHQENIIVSGNVPVAGQEGVIELFGGFPATESDRCVYCKKYFVQADAGKIGCYKPWIDGSFWHLECSEPLVRKMMQYEKTGKDAEFAGPSENVRKIIGSQEDKLEKIAVGEQSGKQGLYVDLQGKKDRFYEKMKGIVGRGLK